MNRISGFTCLALALLVLALAPSAWAVRLAETGQALIYPYYSVVAKEDGTSHQTYLTVVNTASDTKVIRVRFAEGRNHRAALYFNLYLAPQAMWSAAVVPGPKPRLLTTDLSCTNPAIPQAGAEFREFAYVGANFDGAGETLERLEEGFFEVIEMGVLRGAEAAAVASGATPGCGLVQGAQVNFPAFLGSPTGGLTGTAVIINVQSGYSIGFRPIALAQFSAAPIYRDLAVDLSLDAADAVSEATIDGKHRVMRWGDRIVGGRTISGGALAVTSVLMSRTLGNEFIQDFVTGSNTDWVVSSPTKRFFVNGASAAPPFTMPFVPAGSCEAMTLFSIGRDQAAGVSKATALCWSTTVLRFQNAAAHTRAGARSALFASRNAANVEIGSPDVLIQNGSARLEAGARTLVSDAGSTTLEANGTLTTGPVSLTGLPWLGFSASVFVNGELSCGAQRCKSTFAFTTPHVR